ncbi:hypothetical protein [Engelhardtia mirabilis]|uniref:Uncharacterized protein n=1 Tax=Engelhardtia mirabilis TaxID=2528011 RepID=A0A518BLC2_9BACT|nr:hypothetical protein Pla133_28650 [Planctomycetes bacterium Pla133]QDV02102.1 hypothetical protein Pla86_28640 [Planctomycetes bacterium Pla86]
MSPLQRAAAVALALGLALPTTGCLRLAYRRSMVDEAPDPTKLETLQAGDSLAVCLETLGAPTLIWGLGDDGAEGFAAVYASTLRGGWGLNASAPLGKSASGSLEFQTQNLDLDAVVLFFDLDWGLERWREGKLANLLPANLNEITIDD